MLDTMLLTVKNTSDGGSDGSQKTKNTHTQQCAATCDSVFVLTMALSIANSNVCVNCRDVIVT